MNSSFPDHFSGVAHRYADYRPRYPAALFDYLATVVPRNSLVWDCAAGNGQATVDLAKRFVRVIATDASREQIAAAQSISNVDYRIAPAEESGLPDASVSLITVAQALHWFEFDRFYTEARRVLKPSGFLAAWSYGINLVEGAAANELVQRFYSETVGPNWPPERKWVEEGYRTIPFPFPEIVPPPFRMETRWTLGQLLGYLGTWSATTRFIKERGFNPIDPLRQALSEAWPDAEVPRLITWPLALRIGRRNG